MSEWTASEHDGMMILSGGELTPFEVEAKLDDMLGVTIPINTLMCKYVTPGRTYYGVSLEPDENMPASFDRKSGMQEILKSFAKSNELDDFFVQDAGVDDKPRIRIGKVFKSLKKRNKKLAALTILGTLTAASPLGVAIMIVEYSNIILLGKFFTLLAALLMMVVFVNFLCGKTVREAWLVDAIEKMNAISKHQCYYAKDRVVYMLGMNPKHPMLGLNLPVIEKLLLKDSELKELDCKAGIDADNKFLYVTRKYKSGEDKNVSADYFADDVIKRGLINGEAFSVLKEPNDHVERLRYVGDAVSALSESMVTDASTSDSIDALLKQADFLVGRIRDNEKKHLASTTISDDVDDELKDLRELHRVEPLRKFITRLDSINERLERVGSFDGKIDNAMKDIDSMVALRASGRVSKSKAGA